MQDQYEKLEGKEIIYTMGDDTLIGKVVGIDYDIGITVVDKNDTDRYLICIPGPCSPHGTVEYPDYLFDSYDEEFFFSFEAIKDGVFDYDKLMEKAKDGMPFFAFGPSKETCPFGM